MSLVLGTVIAVMSLGRPPAVVETLEQRIAARLNEALDQHVRGGFYAGAERGLAAPDLEEQGAHDVIRLSVEDVSRIAAQEARDWF